MLAARIVLADAAWGWPCWWPAVGSFGTAGGRDPSQVERVAATVLGVRLVMQSLALQAHPGLAPAVTAVESTHAASMAVLGAVRPTSPSRGPAERDGGSCPGAGHVEVFAMNGGRRPAASASGGPGLVRPGSWTDVSHGRFERTLSAADRGRRGGDRGGDLLRARLGQLREQLMWMPGRARPGRRASRAWPGVQPARRPDGAAGGIAAIVANGLQGTYLHARGVAQKPGGWKNARYNIEMGPPLLAPLLVTMVGGMGLLAAVLRAGTVIRGHDSRLAGPRPGGRSGTVPRVRRAGSGAGLGPGDRRRGAGPARPPAPLRFFTAAEEAVARPLLDLLLAQDGEPGFRSSQHGRRPARRAARPTAGTTTTCPRTRRPGSDTWRPLDEDARTAYRRGFADLHRRRAGRSLVQPVQDAGDGRWHGLRADRVWSLWTRYACAAFYSHPWAWNEIGFRGPAYPRGYKNRGVDGREPWEVADRQGTDPLAERARQVTRVTSPRCPAWSATDRRGSVRDRNESAWLLPDAAGPAPTTAAAATCAASTTPTRWTSSSSAAAPGARR